MRFYKVCINGLYNMITIYHFLEHWVFFWIELVEIIVPIGCEWWGGTIWHQENWIVYRRWQDRWLYCCVGYGRRMDMSCRNLIGWRVIWDSLCCGIQDFSLIYVSRKLRVKLFHDFGRRGDVLTAYVAVLGKWWSYHFFVEFKLREIFGVIEVTPRTISL